jgi:VWFA-related protein
MTFPPILAALLATVQPPLASAEAPVAVVLRMVAAAPDGSPLTDLTRDDVVVLEDGVARTVLEVKMDKRPLTVGIVLDTSAAVADAYHLSIARPLSRFLERLPSGSRFAIWTTGERPTQLTELGTDWQQAEEALKRVAPSGGSTLFDAIDLACEGLRRHEGQRFALVIVSAVGVEHSARQLPRAAEPPYCAPASVSVIEIREASGASAEATPQDDQQPLEIRAAYGRTFDTLTRQSGGRLESVLLSSASEPALERILADLKHSYLVRYLGRAGGASPKLKVEVARPKAKVRVARERGAP